jgi:hypothetical protein
MKNSGGKALRPAIGRKKKPHYIPVSLKMHLLASVHLAICIKFLGKELVTFFQEFVSGRNVMYFLLKLQRGQDF